MVLGWPSGSMLASDDDGRGFKSRWSPSSPCHQNLASNTVLWGACKRTAPLNSRKGAI